MKEKELKKLFKKWLEWSSNKQDKLFQSNWLTKKLYSKALSYSKKY